MLIGAFFCPMAEAAWIWSPDIGKWMNLKKAAKDTPEEQYDWAMSFYNRKEWDRAIEEFEKIPDNFPSSKLAAEGVFFVGKCWEAKGDIAKAADHYQNLIDHYPYSDRIKDAVKAEFEIANQFASGAKMKVMGIPVLSGQLKAMDLYQHVVKNAPFGMVGDQAQFKIGELYKAQGEYEEARKAFQAVIDEYPGSSLVARARYEIAASSMESSKKSQYNEQYAERAIEEFQGFKETFPTSQSALEADESIKALREKNAKMNFDTAVFYEKQSKFKSAQVYYQQIAERYPDTSFGPVARKKAEALLRREAEPPAKSKPWYRPW